jgi:hypothetical protein
MPQTRLYFGLATGLYMNLFYYYKQSIFISIYFYVLNLNQGNKNLNNVTDFLVIFWRKILKNCLKVFCVPVSIMSTWNVCKLLDFY